MGERSDLPRLYVAVNPSKLVRCTWCGTLESVRWEHTKGGTFCSDTCQKAAEISTECVQCQCFCSIIMIVICSVVGIEFGIIVSSFLVPIGVLMLLEDRRGKQAALKVPKNSRRKYGLDEFSVLKTIVKHVECPNCDGIIDLTKIEADRIYHCGYCGATGIVEIAHTR